MNSAAEAAIYAAGGILTPALAPRRDSRSESSQILGSMSAPLSPDGLEEDDDGQSFGGESSSVDSLPSVGGGDTVLTSRLSGPSGQPTIACGPNGQLGLGREGTVVLNMHDHDFDQTMRRLPNVHVEMQGPVAHERVRGTKSLKALTNGFRKMVWKDHMLKVRPGVLELYKPWYRAPGGIDDYMVSRMMLSEAVHIGRLTDLPGGFFVGCRCRALGAKGVMCVQFRAPSDEDARKWLRVLQHNAPQVMSVDRPYDPKAAWVVAAHT